MNQNCEKYSGLIEELIKGERLDDEITATEKHIFDCSQCRSEYQLMRREKEILAHYLFNFEPPPDSWINFQARLAENQETIHSEVVAQMSSRRGRKRSLVFSFSPVLATAAGLLLFFGIGFIWLMNAKFEKNGDQEIARTKSENSLRAAEFKTTAATSDDTPKKSLRAKNISLPGKKPIVAKTLKTKGEIVSPGSRKKTANESVSRDEIQSPERRKQKLETQIAVQIEKIELLLRSFRNAQAVENSAGFDLDYEKQQARKLLETNAGLRRDAEIYGISYADELLSRVESYLLEIANLGHNPSPEKVLDLKERVNNQNIIASLQVYASPAGQ